LFEIPEEQKIKHFWIKHSKGFITSSKFCSRSFNIYPKSWTYFEWFDFFTWVGVNCSKFDCSTIICSTLLAGNQLLNTKFINCSNPVNACLTGFEQMTKILSIARIQFKIGVDHYFLLIILQKLLEFNLLDTFCS
jgi:hypothetical protein